MTLFLEDVRGNAIAMNSATLPIPFCQSDRFRTLGQGCISPVQIVVWACSGFLPKPVCTGPHVAAVQRHNLHARIAPVQARYAASGVAPVQAQFPASDVAPVQAQFPASDVAPVHGLRGTLALQRDARTLQTDRTGDRRPLPSGAMQKKRAHHWALFFCTPSKAEDAMKT